MIETAYAFGIMYIACELGHHMNASFNECSEMVDQFDWYQLPLEIQRILPMILTCTQQPFQIIFFGSAACDRETFKCVSVQSN